MNISIIITFYQGLNILDCCLNNINKNTNFSGELEIIIVNDNPSQNIDIIKNKYKNKYDLKIINLKNNVGYSKACNIGVNSAAYEYIILMDSDIFPGKGWLNALIESYNANDNIGVVSSKIIEADTGKLFGYGIGIHGVDIILYKRHGTIDSFSSIDRAFSMISSGCIFFNKSTYLDINGQDETLYNADNDLDLTYRIFKSGKINMLSSKSIVYHRGHVSGNIRVLPSRQDSKAWLFKKWGNKLEDNTLEILFELYNSFAGKISSQDIILVSFSNSLMRRNYFDIIKKALNVNYIQEYDIKNVNMIDKIFINDFLMWDMCRTNIPILYFVDDYRILNDNKFWFENRVCNDIIADKNGNILKPN